MATRFDIDVYGCSVQQIDHWVGSIIGPVSDVTEVLPFCRLLEYAGGTVFMLLPESDQPYVSLTFDFPDLWSTPLACAVQAAQELGCIVGCSLDKRTVEVRPMSGGHVQVVRLVADEDYSGPIIEYI
jgi:hypothetical protein